MADLSTLRRQRGVPSGQTPKLKNKVDRWVSKGGLTAIDLLLVEQAKTRLRTLDTKFKRYHMDVIDSLDDDTETERVGVSCVVAFINTPLTRNSVRNIETSYN